MENKLNQGVAQGVAQPTESVNESVKASVFAAIRSKIVSTDKTRADIIRELLASGNAERVNGLRVNNVTATEFDNHALMTFVVDGFVVGDVRTDEVDPVTGALAVELGNTHNVQTSSFAVSGVMKENPKLAIFANDIVENPGIGVMLFAGSTIDVIQHFVPAGEEYRNPFAKNSTPSIFTRDKVIHYVIRLELGEVGQDLYREKLAKASR